MTEILRAFWKEKRPERIAVLVSGILFAVIFWIYEIPVEIAGYAFLLVILWNVIWFTLVFIRYEKRQRILEENQGKIRTEAGGFPEAESRESEMYQELIRQLYEEKKELESSVQIDISPPLAYLTALERICSMTKVSHFSSVRIF